MNFDATFNTREFEKSIAASCIRVDPELMRHSKIDAANTLDYMGRDLVIRMQTFIYRERQGERTVKVPLNWWEHVKQRWAPDWLLRKYPVKERNITAELWRTFPDWVPPTPDFPPSVRMMELRELPTLAEWRKQ